MATFQENKAAIVATVRSQEICDRWQELMLATDYAGLIAAGMGLFPDLYNSRVVTDAMLIDFPQADLNAAGVYLGGQTVPTVASQATLYLLGTGSHNVTVAENGKLKAYVLGTGSATITFQDFGFANIYTDTATTLNLNGTTTGACLQSVGSAAVTVTNNSTFQARIGSNSNLLYNSGPNGYGLLRIADYGTYTPGNVQRMPQLTAGPHATINQANT